MWAAKATAQPNTRASPWRTERHGRSRKGLAAELNARGVPTATGRGRWSPSTIAGVLASVAYERELHAARTRAMTA